MPEIKRKEERERTFGQHNVASFYSHLTDVLSQPQFHRPWLSINSCVCAALRRGS